jgi:hypothetical protein
MHANGWGVKQNNEEALKWFKKAADQGSALAQFNIGILYSNTGRNEDAVEWLQKAADQNNPDALYQLGVLYQRGMGVNRDIRKSFELFYSANAHGYKPRKD